MRKLTKPELRDRARQRPPLKILAVEHDEDMVTINSAGQLRAAYKVVIADKPGVDENGKDYAGIGALREGYYCARCLEAQGEALPEECWVCGFPMKEKQAEFIAKGYKGHLRIGPSTTADDEVEFMNEWAEKDRRASRDEILRPTQILLPGKDF